MKPKGEKYIELTNVSSLDHADIVSAIADATYTLLGVFPDKTGDVRLLGR